MQLFMQGPSAKMSPLLQLLLQIPQFLPESDTITNHENTVCDKTRSSVYCRQLIQIHHRNPVMLYDTTSFISKITNPQSR